MVGESSFQTHLFWKRNLVPGSLSEYFEECFEAHIGLPTFEELTFWDGRFWSVLGKLLWFLWVWEIFISRAYSN